MLDRVTIWDDTQSNIHVEIKDSEGIAIQHDCITQSEWKKRLSELDDYGAHDLSVKTLVNYIAALSFAVETH